MMGELLHIPALFLSLLAAAATGYLLLLTIAAVFATRRTPLDAAATPRRFAIMVPAHNEELLLGDLLSSLAQLEYPQDRYRVFVVADNCNDGTAALARRMGAQVYERNNEQQRGKGYALRWLLEQVWGAADYDALVIFDADTIVDPAFLRVMNTRLARGERVIQAYYTVRDSAGSYGAGLRAAALTAVHFLRPQGREVLAASVGLKGNGMVFAAEVARTHPWPASLTEDIEYHLALVLAGERVRFAPDAVIAAEMPGTLGASDSQHMRWERGRIEMVQRFVPRLLAAAIQRRSFLLLDAAIDQLIPPLSLLVALGGLGLGLGLLVGSSPAVQLGVGALGGLAIYLFGGLLLAQAPRHVYLALLYAPVYLLWKIALYLRILGGRDRQDWVRTAREGGGR